jgi:hypothetical protein
MDWKKDYIKKIGSTNVDELQIEVAQSIKISNLPEFLYKYRPTTDFAISNFETDTVWLNKPSEYNDPFEFVEYLDFSRINLTLNRLMKEELISTLTEQFPVPDYIKQQAMNSDFPMKIIAEYQFKEFEGRNEKDIIKIFEVLDDALKKIIIDRHIEKIKKIQENMKVCSFCESPNQLLMWSHYADNHRGFCIEYNISRWLPNDVRKRILCPVIYQKDFFDSTDHLLSQMEKGAFNILYPIISGSTKSVDWEYEKEWRFIFNIGDSFQMQNYLMNCQTRVFLGYRMCDSKKRKILEICKSKGLEAYEAKPSDKKYEMEFNLIK